MKKFFTTLAALGFTTMAFAEEGGAAAKGGGMPQMLMMIGVAIAFFYFIVLRPERKRRKAMQLRRSSMQKGDKVTAMGIIGTVAGIREETVVLKLFDGAKMEVLKAAVTDVNPASEVDEKTVELAAE
jgi:preprotein translocase subunit YajC